MKDKNEKQISIREIEDRMAFEYKTRPSIFSVIKLSAELMYSAAKGAAWGVDETYKIQREDRKILHEPRPHVQAVNHNLDKKDISLSTEQAENFNIQNTMEDEYKNHPTFEERERFHTKDQKREAAIAERFYHEGKDAPKKFFKEDYTEKDIEECQKERLAGTAGFVCHTFFKAAKNVVRPSVYGVNSDFQFGDELIDVAIRESEQFNFKK
ncbi:hypothetical protein Lsan_1763 [Legionella santicrucis]|uniref:Uncharacterized protein n=1 Tax=Legionella santicrucis TaxID=45074 RepID=A0A0W0Z0Y7_9GAMM|nr:hypothetical protein [Legionella santicrucis]KTD62776.1 hypothetical protein Lsan_1763 [Legionella santicrucis]